MAVQVCWLDSGFAYFFDLRFPFLLHFVQRERASCYPKQQAFWAAVELPGVIYQAGDQLASGHRWAVA
jgi:hypothetical protein